jgi:16S rRNA U1498 N3-methylase RsmE
MNSRNVFKILLINTILIGFTSCNEYKRVIEKIDFKIDYKFSSEIEDKIAKDTLPWKYQVSASDYTKKGDYKNALIQWDFAMGTRKLTFTETQIDSINYKYSKVKATNYIIEQAKKNQVVIINEAHHNSFHRVFTKSLLKKLFENGFTNLGFEALSHKDSLVNNRKYPIQKTGQYITEPQFGNLVREALEIGYTLFPYETKISGSGIESREKEQAKYIQKVIQSKPNEKFLIHCGFDHNLEGIHPTWGNTMASRLTEYTGINPLTINQVVYSEKSKPEFNNPLLKALSIIESSVIIDKNNNSLKYEKGSAWSDIAVFHPNTEYIDGRPNWLFENGNKNVSISLTDIQIQFPVMVLAFKKGEDINLAVPVDITELENKTDNCNLGLKKGTYEIIVTNGKQSFKFEQKVK